MNKVEVLELNGVMVEINHDVLLEDGTPLIVEINARQDVIITQEE